jgi:putative ABC transport system permease protein
MRRFRAWFVRLGGLFSKQRRERELNEELESHLHMHIEDNLRAGMSHDEARRQVLLKLGGLEQAKESYRDRRGLPILDTLMQDVRYGLRQLRRSPGFTAVAVLTLALGIGANNAIFSLIDAVMLRMLPVEKAEELMQVQFGDPDWGGEGGSFTNPLWEQIRDRQDVFSGAFAWGTDKFDLARGGAVHLANGIWVSGDFFNTLRLRPAAGRLISIADDQHGCPAVAVLSYGFWQDHYGMAGSAVGSSLSLNSQPFEVIGVAPPGFFGMNVGEKFDIAAPICSTAIFDPKDGRLEGRSWWWLTLVGRLKRGVSRDQASARLKVLSPPIFAAALPQNWSADGKRDFIKHTLVAAPAATGLSELHRQFEQPLKVLMGIVGLVLLIACANIAGLMLARAAARRREIAVRQALGASRPRLALQLLTECCLLSFAGALGGILFARWGAALLVRYISTAKNAVFLDLSFDGRVLGFTAAIAALTCVLFGLLPSLRSTQVSLTSAMKGGQALEGGSPGRVHAQKWIVASQVALSIVLLVAAGLLLRSFQKLATLDIGFDRNNVLLVGADLRTAKVSPERQHATFEDIETRLGALTGVVSVGRSTITPISGGGWNEWIRTDWSKGLKGRDALSWFNCVSPGYFQTLRMSLLAGRNFNTSDTKTSPSVAIVNQTLARRFFPKLNPIGKTFRIDDIGGKPGPPIEVIGVVNDAKYESVRDDADPTAFFPATQVPAMFEAETFELRTAMPPSTLMAPIQAAVAGVNKEIPLEFHTLAEQVNDSLVQERLLAVLSAFFGGLALLLAMVGLYGALSYMVTQRQTEFGIRMALGAEAGSILRLVIRDVAVILAGGVAVGVLLSLATTRVLAKLLFGLGARDPVTLVGATAVLSAVAFIAGFIPALRATKVDPIVALRCE